MMIPTKVNFNDSIFQEYPDRLYMYFGSWQPIKELQKLVSMGIHVFMFYEGDSLDPHDRVTVCVSKDLKRGGYTYTYEYRDGWSELQLSKMMSDIYELYKKEDER